MIKNARLGAGQAKLKNKTLDKIAPLLLAAAVIFVYARFCIMPTITGLKELAPKVADLKQSIKSAQVNIKGVDTLKRQLGDLKKRIGDYENRLPQKKEIPNILQRLSEIAVDSGVKITSIEPIKSGVAAESKDYTEVPIALNAKCGYHQLAAFITKLEESRQFMKVTNIKISRNPSDAYRHLIDLRISTFMVAGGEN